MSRVVGIEPKRFTNKKGEDEKAYIIHTTDQLETPNAIGESAENAFVSFEMWQSAAGGREPEDLIGAEVYFLRSDKGYLQKIKFID